ncbi:NAD dependent epimerase/dehydratase family protein [Hypoxylon sp. FL1284]|nr:NAD dependent epimerase/dehydratase family protein [Hypoxylon sp. FL1284]
MASKTSPQILLTGATGYIGGTVLVQLLNSPLPALKDATISCLMRGADRAAKLTATYGDRVRPILYKSLDDIDATIAAAAEHDIVINTTNGWHAASGVALVRGLAQRKAATGRDVWMIWTSGASNIAETPLSHTRAPGPYEFDDARDDVYTHEKEREAREGGYHQRTAELAVVDAGLELGVKTLVVMSPLIYGLGLGLYHTISIQIPSLTRSMLRQGRGAVVGGDGVAEWDVVHVVDLADMYALLAARVAEGAAGVPHGKKGIIFSGNGRHSWLEVAQRVADACHAEGKIASTSLERLNLADGGKFFKFDIDMEMADSENEVMVELGFASIARTVSTVARGLGWKPTRGEDAWKAGFSDDLKAVLAETK